eukprot:3631837-Rhodomonas_salina.1
MITVINEFTQGRHTPSSAPPSTVTYSQSAVTFASLPSVAPSAHPLPTPPPANPSPPPLSARSGSRPHRPQQ